MPVLTLLFANRKLALYAVICGLLAVSHYLAYSKGINNERLTWQAAQTQVLESQLKEIERQKKENAALVAKYQDADKKRREFYWRLQDEIAKNTSGRECFGAGAVRVWNEAVGSTRDMPRTSGGTPKASTGASDTEILANAVKNMEQYKECRDLHSGLREWRDKNFGGK